MQSIKRQNLFIFLLTSITILMALWVYNPFNFYFLNDDLIHIPLSKDGVLFQRQSFRPLGDLSVQLDYLLWGSQAWGYHLTNLLLHVANTILVFFLSNELLKKYTGKRNAFEQSLMVSLLFFVYAFHSESIFWILGRSGSLGVLFFIPAVLFYLWRHKGISLFIVSLLFMELGLLAYESVWIFPLVAIVISTADKKMFSTKARKELLFVAGVVAIFLIHLLVRQQVIGQLIGAYEAGGFIQFDLQKLGSNFFKLLARCFIPPVDKTSTFIVACSCFLALAVATALVIKKRQKAYKSTSGFLVIIGVLFIVSLLPYLSLGINTHSVEGERYLYMPSIFASILLVCIIRGITANTNYQLLFYTMLIGYQLFFLMRSSGYFRTASNISSIAFQQLNALKGKKRLFIDSLPQSYKGALIFRLGFDEGAKWLKKEGTVDSIIILSLKTNNEAWSSTYKVEEVNRTPLPAYTVVLIRDTTQQQTYVVKKIPPIMFNPKTDAWFIFKDDRLEVVK